MFKQGGCFNYKSNAPSGNHKCSEKKLFLDNLQISNEESLGRYNFTKIMDHKRVNSF